jgi:hypothetical protein
VYWFGNCGGRRPRHDLSDLRWGIEAGMTDAQDGHGMTALSLAVESGWREGVKELLRVGADTELRCFRTGETALHLAVRNRDEWMVEALAAAGANPDAANHWGITPRAKLAAAGSAGLFDHIPPGEVRRLPPHIQNAEHLAAHFHPQFEIPTREQRETVRVGQAVALCVYGPKAESKNHIVKVRVTARDGDRPRVRYSGKVETPIERTHLDAGTTAVEFGPEHIASINAPRATARAESSPASI